MQLNIRPFQCIIEGCFHRFKLKSHLLNHQRVVHFSSAKKNTEDPVLILEKPNTFESFLKESEKLSQNHV